MKLIEFFNQKNIREFLLFGLVGVSNTLISLVAYYIFLNLGIAAVLSYSLSYIIGILNSYLLNRKFVFKQKTSNHGINLLKVFTLYIASMLLGDLIIYVSVHIMMISPLIAPVITYFFTIPFNYLANKFWVFKNAA